MVISELYKPRVTHMKYIGGGGGGGGGGGMRKTTKLFYFTKNSRLNFQS